MSIISFDVDQAEWVGDEQDGCYVYVEEVASGEHKPGWYTTVVVDSETGSFVDNLCSDQGPFETRDEALESGMCVACDWCLTNAVSWEEA
jgi:hypothetical protein